MHKSGKPVSERANQDVLSLVHLAATSGRMPTNQELYFAGITKPEFNIILKQHLESRIPVSEPTNVVEAQPMSAQSKDKNVFGKLMQRGTEWLEGVDEKGELEPGHKARYSIKRDSPEDMQQGLTQVKFKK